MTSSTNHHILPTTGLICRGTQVVGALRLPDEATDAFVERFNAAYRAVGLRLEVQPVPTQDEAPSPEASERRAR